MHIFIPHRAPFLAVPSYMDLGRLCMNKDIAKLNQPTFVLFNTAMQLLPQPKKRNKLFTNMYPCALLPTPKANA